MKHLLTPLLKRLAHIIKEIDYNSIIINPKLTISLFSFIFLISKNTFFLVSNYYQKFHDLQVSCHKDIIYLLNKIVTLNNSYIQLETLATMKEAAVLKGVYAVGYSSSAILIGILLYFLFQGGGGPKCPPFFSHPDTSPITRVYPLMRNDEDAIVKWIKGLEFQEFRAAELMEIKHPSLKECMMKIVNYYLSNPNSKHFGGLDWFIEFVKISDTRNCIEVTDMREIVVITYIFSTTLQYLGHRAYFKEDFNSLLTQHPEFMPLPKVFYLMGKYFCSFFVQLNDETAPFCVRNNESTFNISMLSYTTYIALQIFNLTTLGYTSYKPEDLITYLLDMLSEDMFAYYDSKYSALFKKLKLIVKETPPLE